MFNIDYICRRLDYGKSSKCFRESAGVDVYGFKIYRFLHFMLILHYLFSNSPVNHYNLIENSQIMTRK